MNGILDSAFVLKISRAHAVAIVSPSYHLTALVTQGTDGTQGMFIKEVSVSAAWKSSNSLALELYH